MIPILVIPLPVGKVSPDALAFLRAAANQRRLLRAREDAWDLAGALLRQPRLSCAKYRLAWLESKRRKLADLLSQIAELEVA